VDGREDLRVRIAFGGRLEPWVVAASHDPRPLDAGSP